MTETQTVSITQFLLARIAEDEGRAEDWLRWEIRGSATGYYPARDRVLAQCQAHRRIVESEADYSEWNQPMTAILAAIYADHPDYDPSWRA